MKDSDWYSCSYDEETYKHLRNVELMILNDFIQICEENNFHYHLHAGSLLGSIRHHGFIPWDDEIDVAMFREDYEKFVKLIETKFYDKYHLVNWKNDFNIEGDIYTPKSSLCLKDTSVTNLYSDKLGIFLDITVLDLVPKNPINQFIFLKSIKLIHFSFYFFNMFRFDRYTTNFRRDVGNTLEYLFKVFHITPKFILKRFTHLISIQKKEKCSYLLDTAFYYKKPLPLEAFNGFEKVKFEHINVYIPEGYDLILKIIYGNYMEFPSREDRHDHDFNPIDFGKY